MPRRRPPAQPPPSPPILWPGRFQFRNYVEAIDRSAFGTWFWNTTVVTVAIVASNLVLCSLAAYAFARIRFLGRSVVYFVLTQFFRTLPIELEEAARIDGASRLGVLLRIVLPLSLPALATLAVIQFMWTWNDFLWPLVTILTNQDAFTLQLGLATFQGAHQTTWHLLAAANIMSMLPMLALFLVAQRYFVRGIATQGLKG